MLQSHNVRVWKLTNLPQRPILVVATDSGGAVWTQVTIDTSPGGGDKTYTHNKNEVSVKNTRARAVDLVAVLLDSWSDLLETGARTLTAQHFQETGAGVYCFNWNLGNVKEPNTNVPHMYLKNVSEGVSPSEAENAVAHGGGHAHVPTADELAKHPGWKYANVVVLFNPPHPASRFHAYATLQEGAQAWVQKHKSFAARVADYLQRLNAGDCAYIAHVLKRMEYYTGVEAAYARGMTSYKAQTDKELGLPGRDRPTPIEPER